VGIGFGSGLVCSLLICVCVSVSCKRERSKPNILTLSESDPNLSPFLVDGRHYSVVLDKNPSYNRHHGKKTVFNPGPLEAGENRYSTNESPCLYTL